MDWKPDKIWSGLDVFVIGGGHSLKDFDFKLLEEEKTIGCNNAYKFGVRSCNICIFGDKKWFEFHKNRLVKYVDDGGFVVTNDNKLAKSNIPWLHYMPRSLKGLHTDKLGWCTNTGASAINLALILGAKRVYLLGFDRHLNTKGQPNYHTELLDKPDPFVYQRMNQSDASMKNDLKKKFPDSEVLNVTDVSTLTLWPKISFKEFWEERKNKHVSQ